MAQLHSDTADGTFKTQLLSRHSSWTSRWDSYIRTQQMGHLHLDTADGTVTLEHSRWDNYNMGQLHQNTVDETVTRWLVQLHQNTVDETVMLEYSRCDSYRILQMGQLQQNTVDGTVITWGSYIRTQQMRQLFQNRADWTVAEYTRQLQNRVDRTITIEHSRQGSYNKTQQIGRLQ